jgi:hypothetical protein
MRDALAVRETLWAHPEWWVLAMGAGSWWILVRDGLARWGHKSAHPATLSADIVTWQLMVMAMMLPALLLSARTVAFRCFAEWRHAGIAAFLVSYLGIWTAFGAGAMALRQPVWTSAPWTLAVLCAAATVWAMLPVRERAMMQVHTHAPIIAPDGWRSLRDCAVTGFGVGTSCIVSCWPLMLACVFSGHDLAVIAVGGTIGLVESRSFRPPRRLVIGVTAALTLFVALR